MENGFSRGGHFLELHLASKEEHDQGPLHTQAKSRDHEIVRDVSKGSPKTLPKTCSVVIGPQV